jgi:hypothetical protein
MRRSAKPIKKPHLQGSIVFRSNTPNWLYRRCDNVRTNRGQSLVRMKRRVRVRQSAIAYEDALSVTQDKHVSTAAQPLRQLTILVLSIDFPHRTSRTSTSSLSSHLIALSFRLPCHTLSPRFLAQKPALNQSRVTFNVGTPQGFKSR